MLCKTWTCLSLKGKEVRVQVLGSSWVGKAGTEMKGQGPGVMARKKRQQQWGFGEKCWELLAKGRTTLEMNLRVSLLAQCDGELAQHGEKFSVHTVTNSYGIMKSQTSHGKRLEERSLVTRDYFLHFQQGSSLEGIQTSTVSSKVKKHFVQFGIPGHWQGYNIITRV